MNSASLLAGRHGGSVDGGERVREVLEPDGQRVSLEHFRAHAEDDALEPRFLGLLADREQRLLERQARAHERRELAREEREVEARHAAPQAELASSDSLALLDFCDFDGIELLFAQQLAHVARRIALEHAAMLFTDRIDRDVLVRAHQSARVTRTTSSSVVTPDRTFCIPSSRMLGVSVRA